MSSPPFHLEQAFSDLPLPRGGNSLLQRLEVFVWSASLENNENCLPSELRSLYVTLRSDQISSLEQLSANSRQLAIRVLEHFLSNPREEDPVDQAAVDEIDGEAQSLLTQLSFLHAQ